MSEQADTRCGFVALIGAPNAGKSTLLNQLVGSKVSIVSRKVQTTRTLVRGIALHGPSQIIFVDTPGIFAPRRRLDRAMVTSAWSGAADADIVALLVDAKKGVDEEIAAILKKLADTRQPKALVLNKIDLIPRAALLALSADLNQRVPFEATFMVSALSGDGVAMFTEWLAQKVKPGPWLYPEDQVSDAPLRVLAAEIIDALAARAVCGPANNPLAARDGADRLAARGILYAPDFVVNAGGVVYLDLEAKRLGTRAEIMDRVAGIGDVVRALFDDAEARGITPLEAAEQRVAERLRDAGATAEQDSLAVAH